MIHKHFSQLLFLAVLPFFIGMAYADSREAGRSDMAATDTDTNAGVTLDVKVNKSNLLTVTITNKQKVPIVIDKDLVFMLSVSPVGSDGVRIPRDQKTSLPQLDPKVIASRFVSLTPNESIVRNIDLNSPFKAFVFGQSIPPGAFSAFEAFLAIPNINKVAEVEVEYGSPRELVGLRYYVGRANIPARLFTRQLRCIVKISQSASPGASSEEPSNAKAPPAGQGEQPNNGRAAPHQQEGQPPAKPGSVPK